MAKSIFIGISQNKNNNQFSNYDEEKGFPSEKRSQFLDFIRIELTLYRSKYTVFPFQIVAGSDTNLGFLNFFL